MKGVALVLVSPAGEILTLEEFESKPHIGKYAGMRSIPMETSHPGEKDVLALKRLVTEELPDIERMIVGPATRIGRYQIVPKVWVALYKAEVLQPILPRKIGKEVGNHKWVTAEEALTFWLRQGAKEMISDFQRGKTRVVRKTCEPPRNS